MTEERFQNLKPCIDNKGHTFVAGGPAAGNFGYAFTYCSRCGKLRSELNRRSTP